MKMPNGAGTRTCTPAKARLFRLLKEEYSDTFEAFVDSFVFFIFLQNYAKTLFVIPVISIPEKLSKTTGFL